MTLTLDILTNNRTYFRGLVHQVTFAAHDGIMGILPNHAPFITALDSVGGTVSWVLADDTALSSLLAVGGMVHVMPDRVTFLVDDAYTTDDLDLTTVRNNYTKASAQDPHSIDARTYKAQLSFFGDNV
jgi:F-type H+-transporting ATPase subunit epsilon